MGFKYLIFGEYIDEVLMMVDLNSTNSIANGDYYYGYDHLYSPAVLFYYDGIDTEIVERYEYDAYGKVQVLTDSDGDGTWFDDADDTVYACSQYGNPYTFTGRRLDVFDCNPTTGEYDFEIMYYRARYYDTDTGRFIQRDPLGITPNAGEINPFATDSQYKDGLNLLGYVLSNPINHSDSLGLLSCPFLGDVKVDILGVYLYPAMEDVELRDWAERIMNSLNIIDYINPDPLGVIESGVISIIDEFRRYGSGEFSGWSIYLKMKWYICTCDGWKESDILSSIRPCSGYPGDLDGRNTYSDTTDCAAAAGQCLNDFKDHVRKLKERARRRSRASE